MELMIILNCSNHPTFDIQMKFLFVWFKLQHNLMVLGNDALIDKPFTSHVTRFINII